MMDFVCLFSIFCWYLRSYGLLVFRGMAVLCVHDYTLRISRLKIGPCRSASFRSATPDCTNANCLPIHPAASSSS